MVLPSANDAAGAHDAEQLGEAHDAQQLDQLRRGIRTPALRDGDAADDQVEWGGGEQVEEEPAVQVVRGDAPVVEDDDAAVLDRGLVWHEEGDRDVEEEDGVDEAVEGEVDGALVRVDLLSKKPTSNGVMKAVKTRASIVTTSQIRRKRECGWMIERDILRMRTRFLRTSSLKASASVNLKEAPNKLLIVAEELSTRLFRLSSAAKVADCRRLTNDSLSCCGVPKSEVICMRAGLGGRPDAPRAGSPCGLVGLLRQRIGEELVGGVG